MQLVIDGRDTDVVRKILETEALFVQDRDAKAEAIFMTLGGYSPTLGIIGTVLGLIAMLQAISAARSAATTAGFTASIGTATAQAFVATFFGILLANLLWLPMASRIKERNKQLLLLARDHDRRHSLDPGRGQPEPARRETQCVPRSKRSRCRRDRAAERCLDASLAGV